MFDDEYENMPKTTLKMMGYVAYSHPKLKDNIIYLLQKCHIYKNIIYNLYSKFYYSGTYFDEKYEHNIFEPRSYFSILLPILSNVLYKSQAFVFVCMEEPIIKYIVTYIKFNNKIPIYNALINDDIEKLQYIISKNNIDLKEIFNFPFYEKDIFLRSATLLQYSAFLGSIKCFKYLLMNTANIDFQELLEYSIAGGNIDIIHITEIESHDKKITQNEKLLKIAIVFMQNDLIEYIVNEYGIEITTENFYQCYDSFNLSAFSVLLELVCLDPTDEKEMEENFFYYAKYVFLYVKEVHKWDEIAYYNDNYYDENDEDDTTELWFDYNKNLEDDKNYMENKMYKAMKFNHDKLKCHNSSMNKEFKKISQKKKRKSRNRMLKFEINDFYI